MPSKPLASEFDFSWTYVIDKQLNVNGFAAYAAPGSGYKELYAANGGSAQRLVVLRRAVQLQLLNRHLAIREIPMPTLRFRVNFAALAVGGLVVCGANRTGRRHAVLQHRADRPGPLRVRAEMLGLPRHAAAGRRRAGAEGADVHRAVARQDAEGVLRLRPRQHAAGAGRRRSTGQDYADIVAYILAQSGVPAGTEKFTPTSPMERVLELRRRVVRRAAMRRAPVRRR